MHDDDDIEYGVEPHPPLAVSVEPLDDFRMKVGFKTGEFRLVDMKPLFSHPYYAPLNDEALFRQARVAFHGMTVEWPNGKDVYPEYLYWESEVVE